MVETTETELIVSAEFKERVRLFKEDFHRKYEEISKEVTPQVDGEGRKIIEKRPDGYDYIVEAYMRDCLDRHFPGWSWEAAAPLQFLGSEWVVAQGHLVIIDEHLLAFGINPPVRKFFGVDSVRIQFKRGTPHTPENIVDIGDNCKQANTAALKYAINRLTHIGDDVYGKRVEPEGAGTFESILEANPDADKFGHWVTQNKWSWGEIIQILGVKSMTEVADFGEAFKKVKEAKGIK
jgi:hypothetical protein